MKSIIFVLLILFSIVLFFDDSYAFENGLIEGQWVKYKISGINIAAENATLATFIEGTFEGFKEISFGDQQISPESIDWFKIQIDTVEDRSFTGKIIIMTTSGQEPAGATPIDQDVIAISRSVCRNPSSRTWIRHNSGRSCSRPT